jgi:hypothetical protein
VARGWSELRPAFEVAGGDNMAKPAAQALILDAVRAGDFLPLPFVQLRLTSPQLPGIAALVEMAPRALQLGKPGDSMRVPVTHKTMQAVADLLGLRVPTAAALDELVRGASPFVEPFHTQNLNTMAHLADAEKHSADLDAAGSSVDNVKAWINHRRLLTPSREKLGKDTGINYLWATRGKVTARGVPGPKPSVTGGALNVFQEPGGAHSVNHADRSQFAIGYMRPGALIDTAGIVVPMSLDLLAFDPMLHPLLSPAGPIPMRHPWLAECKTLTEGGSCPVPPPRPPTPPGATPIAKRSNLAPALAGASGAALLLYLLLRES